MFANTVRVPNMPIIRFDEYEAMVISKCLCVLFIQFDAVIKCLISFGP